MRDLDFIGYMDLRKSGQFSHSNMQENTPKLLKLNEKWTV